MKNIFFGLLILSSSLICSTNIETNIEKKEDLQPSHEQKIAARIQAFKERARSKNSIANQQCSFDGWKVTKGLIGLWLSTPLFFSGSEGILFLLMCPDHIMSKIIPSPSATSSPIEKFLTNRFLLLSFCSALTAFSLLILKKSIFNLYHGFYGTENTREYFE